jgi:4'-phosphopantetheinyl transferase
LLTEGPDRGTRVCGELNTFSLDIDAPQRAELAGLLSVDERARAARFLAEVHRDRFIVAHGILRQSLAKALGVVPASIEFATSAHGKPRLTGAMADSGLQFNLSHSGMVGLVGLAWQREIGVDVEVWRDLTDEAALVQRFFSSHEIAAYEALAPASRTHGFFNCWTRKEAYVKAVGRGLSLPLDSFDVSLSPAAAAKLLRASRVLDDARQWSLAALDIGPAISAAVVLEGDGCHIFAADLD